MSTINELLNRALAIKNELKLKEIVCVFDQAIYCKAIEIKLKHMDQFNEVILRMGTFHVTCIFILIMGKIFQDAGLRDILTETDLIAGGSVSSVLDGKMYNHGINAHKFIYDALLRLVFDVFLYWIKDTTILCELWRQH